MATKSELEAIDSVHLELAEIAIDSLANGQGLKPSLKAAGISQSIFFKLTRKYPHISIAYGHAQLSRSELLAEEIVEIADNEPDAARARVMVDARKWYASKINPKKYGDRLDLTVSGVVDIRHALDAAKARASLPTTDYKVIDTTTPVATDAIDLALPSIDDLCNTES